MATQAGHFPIQTHSHISLPFNSNPTAITIYQNYYFNMMEFLATPVSSDFPKLHGAALTTAAVQYVHQSSSSFGTQ